jgi:hypothetical protein
MILRLLRVLSLAVVPCVLLASCDLTTTSTTAPDTALSIARQQTIYKVQALPSRYPVDFMSVVESPRLDGWFDPNEYFSVLKHLSMDNGKVLDYYYYSDGMGGGPILYVRKADTSPAGSLNEFKENYYSFYDDSRSYLNHVRADDTEESYFQFVVLKKLGGQFYLFWHSNYNDAQIICDNEALEAVLKEDTFVQIPNDIKAKARLLDINPTVKMNQDSAVVSLVYFTKWGGFIRETYTISRSFPHTVQSVDGKTLVEWQCGVMF